MAQLKKVKLFMVANQYYTGIGYKTMKEAQKEMHRLNNIKSRFSYHIDKELFLTTDKSLM